MKAHVTDREILMQMPAGRSDVLDAGSMSAHSCAFGLVLQYKKIVTGVVHACVQRNQVFYAVA